MTDKKWIAVFIGWSLVLSIVAFLPNFITIAYSVIMRIVLGWIFVGVIIYIFLGAYIEKKKNNEDKENDN